MLTQRRHDIDWMRVIAIGLLLIYHISIAFQPWGVFIQFIQSNEALESLWSIMSMINIWRIPFLFFVSGMGVYFALRKRNWKQLLKERTIRILVPFLFGISIIVPAHVWLWSDYYNQPYSFDFNPAHLWFLGNIFSYVLIGLPLLYYMYNKQEKIGRWLSKFLNHPLKLVLIAVPLIIEVILIAPASYETYALTWHGYFLGLVSFISGYMLMISGPGFWHVLKKWFGLYLAIAFTMYLFRLIYFDLIAPGYWMSIEATLWILGVFGIAYRYLNKPGKTLSYLSEAAYPIYIVHMIWIYLASYFFFRLDINPWHQLIIVTLITFIGSFVSYHFLIRPNRWIRPLFGLKVSGKRITVETSTLNSLS